MNDQLIKEDKKPEKLVLSEQLIIDNKYTEALKILIKLEKEKELPIYYRFSCLRLQARLLVWVGKLEESLKKNEQAYELSLRLGKTLEILDPLCLMALVNFWLGKEHKAEELIGKAEEIFNTVNKQTIKDYIKREANLYFIKGYIISMNNATEGLKHLEYSLSLWEQLDPQIEKAMNLMCIGLTLSISKGELDQSIKYLEQALTIAEDIKNNFGIAFLLLHLGNSYSFKGEINRSLEYYQKSLQYYLEIDNKPQIASLYAQIGEILGEKGELKLSLEYIEKSLAKYKELGPSYSRGILGPLGAAVEISIINGDINIANEYFSRFKQINEQLKIPIMNLWATYYDSIILKKSARTRDKAKAEELLKSVFENSKDIRFSLTINALIHLCDIYLTELYNTNNLEVIDDINPIIEQLLEIARSSHSYLVLCETYILQAKLALITLDIKDARKFLTKAQELADKYEMNYLSIKISNEHDELLKQSSLWKNLRARNAPVSERIKLTHLTDQIDNMLRKNVDESIEVINEDPIVLLITSEGGTPIFSKSFVDEFSFRDHLWSGFLTAFNSFSDEMLSEGLDRAQFGEYTLLMRTMSPFLVCYLYKGQSYLAQEKLQNFIKSIIDNNAVWQTFNNYYRVNRELQLDDLPLLEKLLNESFLTNYNLEE